MQHINIKFACKSKSNVPIQCSILMQKRRKERKTIKSYANKHQNHVLKGVMNDFMIFPSNYTAIVCPFEAQGTENLSSDLIHLIRDDKKWSNKDKANENGGKM